jgi:hypothetical protein
MPWLNKNNASEILSRDPRIASPTEIRNVFESQSEQLLWLAGAITGDPTLAARCVIDASKLTENNSALFRDWLAQWARNATVHSALDQMQAQISHAAETSYERVRCPHDGHETLSNGEVAALEQWPSSELAACLDPLARAVLILRGVQHAAIQDCALRLNVSRAAILAAYCHAIDWLSRGTASLCNEYQPASVLELAKSLQKP